MDSRIARLTSILQCENFERNALAKGEAQLVVQARARKLELKADEFQATTPVERACLLAVFAYEETLLKKNGKHVKASRTWQMIKRRGILSAAEQAVMRPTETMGFAALHEIGLDQFTFESVILRYPSHFSDAAVTAARARIDSIASA